MRRKDCGGCDARRAQRDAARCYAMKPQRQLIFCDCAFYAYTRYDITMLKQTKNIEAARAQNWPTERRVQCAYARQNNGATTLRFFL